MVKALHRAGIEVILDVVYNHTAEGNHLGPMLSFKGVDNASYYRLVPDDERHYMDYTGTGNTLDARHPSVLRLIMDSLRYWVSECHVDGFRFDLASALARELYDVDRLSAFFDTIHQDPILSQVKLIAEPWDVGPGGYQVGNFPVLWSEWNGIYRDVVRDFWRGQSSVGEFASRFTGSSDLYESDGRQPFASINFVTAHDGFTLRDLVSYNEKHNEANGEGNRDGTDDNRSWNCGVEGETDDPAIIALRWRQQRNFLATLFLSQGVPMLLGGDELGRTQHGNNNGWCQDNELSWYEWGLREGQGEHLDFTERLIELRKAHPVFRRGKFLAGRESEGSGLPDVWWFRPDGRRMTQRDWQQPVAHVLGVFLNGQEIADRTPRGEPIEDDSFLVLFNAHHEDMTFTLPARRFGARVGARARHLRADARARRAALAVARRGGRARAVDEAAAPRLMIARTACSSRPSRTSPPCARSCPTCASWASRTCTSRRRCRRAPAPRTATTSSIPRASPRRWAGRRGCARWPPRAWASCSTSCPTTWACPTRTAGGPTSASARGSSTTTPPTAGTGASSTSTTWPACASRTPRSSRCCTARCSSSCATACSTGCASTIPTGSPTRAATWSACATPAPRTCGSRRSCTPASPCATGPWRAPSATSSSTTRPPCSSTRRARRRSRACRAQASRSRTVAARAQLEQATTTFAREVDRLRALADVDGIPEALAALPIYRTYVEPWSGRVEEADRAAIAAAARGRLADVLALDERGHDELVTRFQQTSPPVTAKGIEDTAFYRHLRLLALNEVGGDPARFGLSVDAFHAANASRAERFPRGLLVTQTHDTKRSGDVRARIGALSTMADEWAALAARWVGEAGAPDEHSAYLILQTLVGCWPIEPERLEAYVEKALREAKLRTSWAAPDEAYEAAARRCARGLVETPPEGFAAFAERVAVEGRRAALGQLLLKLTAPGVPDVYQGDELEALSLVDPDNRRPVDWAARRAALARLRAGAEPADFGERKLDLIRRALALRARRPEAFAGSYEPIDAGPDVCAYVRGGEVLVVVPVRAGASADVDAPGDWRPVLSGAWPVALLERA